MSAFYDNVVTDAGRLLFSEIQLEGAKFVPTKIVVGSGYLPEGKTTREMTAVVTPVVDIAINKADKTDDGSTIFGGILTNENVTEDFFFRELALYAKLIYDDNTEGPETLYSYGNAGANAELIPAYSTETLIERQLDLIVYIGNDTEIKLEIETGLFVTVTVFNSTVADLREDIEEAKYIVDDTTGDKYKWNMSGGTLSLKNTSGAGQVNIADKETQDEIKETADTINANTNGLNDKIGDTDDEGGSVSAGSIFAKLNKIISDFAAHITNWTAARAEKIDAIATNTETSNTASETGTLSQKISKVIEDVGSVNTELSEKALEASAQEIISSIGETDDTGGTTLLGTVMAKNNKEIALGEAAMQGLNNIETRLSGMSTPYGNGIYGDLIFDSDDFVWPSQDYYNRYVVQVKSLTIPEGQTMRPPAKCDGLYILSQGDVTINGNIDVTGLRKTFGNVAISPTINVGSQEFQLAVGGYAPIGGANGASGKIVGARSLNDETGEVFATFTSESPTSSIAGNVNGGGVGTAMSTTEYGRASYSTGSGKTSVAKYGEKTVLYSDAAGALIIIAKGTVTINGKSIANSSGGVNATAGTKARIDVRYGISGTGGMGAIPPGGGGCVTIICDQFICNGGINTNGNKLISPNGTSYTNQKVYSTGANNYGAEGGKGGTFISTAGEIKVYTGVSE